MTSDQALPQTDAHRLVARYPALSYLWEGREDGVVTDPSEGLST